MQLDINIYTDSAYVINSITKWIKSWQKSNWKNSKGQDVKNKDLGLLLDKHVSMHEVKWFWVKGHSGHEENEIADTLANRGIDQL